MYITIDIGGTTTRIAISKDLKSIKKIYRFSTIKIFDQAIKKITKSIEEISKKDKIQAIIIGLPGTIDKKTKKIINAPNLKTWENKPIGAILSKKFNCEVFIENDTALGGLGEALFGAGKQYQIVAYIAIGTGLGGVRIVNKQIDKSTRGFEPGHQIINIKGKKWSTCGQRGCLESYVSGKAFYKNYKIRPEKCKSLKIWNNFSKNLAQGIINIITLWSPDIIIIGGGFSERTDFFLKTLKQYVKKNLLIFKPPQIIKSKLGDSANLYGGLKILKTRLKKQ